MIQLIKKGLYSSVQDLGRASMQPMGVPQSGAMDLEAAMIANRVLGNQDSDAVLEITQLGPELLFKEATYIAFSGGAIEVFLDDVPQEHRTIISVQKEQRLHFGKIQQGCRVYMAVLGGIQTELVLNSRSFYKPITPKNTLELGVELPFKTGLSIPSSKPYKAPNVFTGILEAFPGPEYDLLKRQHQYQIETILFKVGHLNNRMAYQLEPSIAEHKINQITVPVLPGTVQLTPQGTLIVLMRDGQTTGGYPRVLQLCRESVNHLAQLTTANEFKFKIITKF